MPTSPERPRLVGDGPVTFSTSLDLVLRPIWDVNRYYADLGVGVRATKGQIARAYHRSARDAHLTYVTKQLLDPAVRRAYDLCDRGDVFVDDEVLARIRAARADTVVSDPSGTLAPVPAEPPVQVFDTDPVDLQDAVCTDRWPFAHYLWRTTTSDPERLTQWLYLLVSALGRRGVRSQISVGLSGGSCGPVEVVQVGGRTVIFLHEQYGLTDAPVTRAVSRLTDPLVEVDPTDRNTTMAEFRRGAQEAQEASKAGAQFARTHYFQIDDGKSEILRLLTDHDAWIVVDQHQNVPTRSKPSDYPDDSKWPDKMPAVCRKDKAFEGMYADCFICEHVVGTNGVKRPGARTWALAVLREEVRENGQVVGYRDKTREVAVMGEDGKPTKETKTEKAIVVVNMGYKNFFAALAGFGAHYHTVLDRDYLVKRSGTGTDTTYNIIPMDPIAMADGGVFDVRRPEVMARYGDLPDLGEIVTERSSDEYYARFFDTRVAQPATKQNDSDKSTGTPASPPTSAASEPGREALEAMALRVKGYASTPATPAAPDSAAPDNDTPASPETPATAAPGGGMRDFG